MEPRRTTDLGTTEAQVVSRLLGRLRHTVAEAAQVPQVTLACKGVQAVAPTNRQQSPLQLANTRTSAGRVMQTLEAVELPALEVAVEEELVPPVTSLTMELPQRVEVAILLLFGASSLLAAAAVGQTEGVQRAPQPQVNLAEMQDPTRRDFR